MQKILFFAAWFLFVLTSEATNVSSSFCVAVNSQIDDVPGSLDGLSATILTDFGWVLQQCGSNSGPPFHYNSGWLIQSPLSLQINFIPRCTVSTFQIQRRLDATVTGGDIDISIIISFQAGLQFIFNGRRYNTTFFGEVSKRTSAFPFAASSNFPITWRAWLDSPRGSNPIIRDMNLFDGASPSVLLVDRPIGSNISKELLSFLLFDAANVNIRMNAYRTQPSFLPSSLRGAFLSSDYLFQNLTETRIDGEKISFQANATVRGTLLQPRGVCRGATCPSTLWTVLHDIVKSTGIRQVCSSLRLLNRTVESVLTADLFVDNVNLTLRGVYAETRALFHCADSANGFIGLRLLTSVASDIPWPIVIFITDSAALKILIKSRPPTPHVII